MFNLFPYTDFHELNLDWILKMIRSFEKEFTEFQALNTITIGGEWDITSQYAKWTIVSYNNNGYLSTQPVPAGIDINNTDYWIRIFDYDSIVEDFEERIAALEDLTSVLNRKIIFVGDSYMNGDSGNQQAEYTSFVRIACGSLGWVENQDYFIACRSGIGFATAAPYNFINELQNFNLPSGITEDEITDVIVFGGSNDYNQTTAAVTTAIRSFCTYAHNRFTKAKVQIGFFANTYNATRKEGLVNILPAYMNSYANYGFINNSQYALRDYSWFVTDSVHPNQDGQNQMAGLLLHYLVNGQMSVDLPRMTPSCAPDSFDNYLNITAISQVNDKVSMVIGDSDFTNNSLTVTTDGSQYYIFGYINTGYIRGLPDLQFQMPGFAFLESSVVCPIVVKFNITGGTLYGRLYSYVYSAGNMGNYTGKATKIRLFGTTVEFDAMKC